MTKRALPNRAIIRLTGPDMLALLDRTVTHSVDNWQTGEMRYGALLTPQGKIIADYLAMLALDDIYLDVHADAADDLERRLRMFRLRSDVVIERLTEDVVTEGSWVDVRSTHLPHRAISPKGTIGLEMPEEEWHAHRIAAGVPEWGADYRATEVFPTDVNLDILGGVDYKKGCFVGQEVASRMKRKGKIRKRTLPVSGDALVVGADIMADTPIGRVTSVAGTAGLALVRTDRLAAAESAGRALTCNGAPVSVDKPAWLESELLALAADD
ncbi:YgfZ/GcvT domain-containing protein [Hyphomonas johnsonii]|jgi:folate-binding protein YgfZ|uniref:Putative aminomethyltransferase n=1 Tax=Hyphomonas johnsonii MHS-2 TaxID=1280950 RepID=A0A059FFL3_9PROT|nr:folate-binding protein YgfZ [Hyphomonas johnsonii]KCZ89425.1 putative aminomethyltransferase [Hyphomonas johnsonii MHS-2]